jgi:hypothetical protein
VLGLNITAPALLSGLLLPGDPEGWNLFERQRALQFAPEDVMPGERSRFNQLRDDENILNIVLCRIMRMEPASGVVTNAWAAYARGNLGRNKFNKKNGPVYDPVQSPNAVEFVQREFDNVRLAIEEVGRTPEAEVFDRAGLKLLIDSRTGTNYSGSLLGILDALNRDPAGNPLFRAFLALRIHAMMELRRHSWDAHWAPNAALDLRRLRELGAESIKSGDWMLPGGRDHLVAKLEEHFTQARRVSYLQQAKFHSTLARRAVEAGFSHVGHADAEGQTSVPTAPVDGVELWGWAARTKAPALLFRYRGADRRFVTVNPPMPLTPLFAFRLDRRQLLAEVRQSVSSNPSELGSNLPPLFHTEAHD